MTVVLKSFPVEDPTAQASVGETAATEVRRLPFPEAGLGLRTRVHCFPFQ
jgi:hypothetical protein